MLGTPEGVGSGQWSESGGHFRPNALSVERPGKPSPFEDD
jgi:hypothetical protein